MAQDYWLLVEAQNFSASVDDTQDLSTIRGGSAMMRLGVRKVDELLVAALDKHAKYATIGGSIGIWHLSGERANVLAAVAKARAALLKPPAHEYDRTYRHVGFSFALVPAVANEPYSSTRKRLAAVSAQQRYTQARTAYPDRAIEDNPYKAVCPVDFVRPVPQHGTGKVIPKGKLPVSRSVHERRRIGMDSKHEVLRDVTTFDGLEHSPKAKEFLTEDASSKRPFAMQTDSISESAQPPELLRKTLHDKICVIHLDGNGFGDMQDNALKNDDSPAGQKKFDEELQQCLGQLILSALDVVLNNGGVGPPPDGEMSVRRSLRDDGHDVQLSPVVRFETLLWGGDEIMFIVPARLGWQVAEALGQTAAGLRINDTELTFGIGMVFCHHDAPISRIKELADELAAYAKKKGKKDELASYAKKKGKKDELASYAKKKGKKSEPFATCFAPVVMESFDHSGGNVGDLMNKRTPHCVSKEDAPDYLTLTLDEMVGLRDAANKMRGNDENPGPLSRRRLRLLARLIQSGGNHGVKTAAEVITEGDTIIKDADCLGIAERMHGAANKGRFWRLLEEYWDYLLPEQLPEKVTMPEAAE